MCMTHRSPMWMTHRSSMRTTHRSPMCMTHVTHVYTQCKEMTYIRVHVTLQWIMETKKMAQHAPRSCEAWQVCWRKENNATENKNLPAYTLSTFSSARLWLPVLPSVPPAGEKLADVRHTTTHDTKKTTKTTTVVYWVMKPTWWRDDRFQRTFNFHRSTAQVVISQHAASAAVRLYTSKIENWSVMARQGSEDCCVTWIMSQV